MSLNLTRNISLEDLPDRIRRHQDWVCQWKAASYRNDPSLGELSLHEDRLDLTETVLSGVDLSQTNLYRMLAGSCKLTNINFSSSSLINVVFFRANLTGSNFCMADLTSADLSQTKLQNVNFLGANLTGCRFTYSDLRGAQFDINISQCWDFTDCKFSSDALPWLILHPNWAGIRDTVMIDDAYLDAEVSA